MAARMTSTAFGRGALNAFISLVILVSGLAGLTAGIAAVTRQPFSGSVGVAILVLLGAVSVSPLLTWILARRARGRVLLDCGPHPMRAFFIMGAIFISVLLFSGGLREMLLGNAVPAATLMAAGIVSVWVFGVQALGRLQLLENGVSSFYGLMRWERIAAYQWTADSTLLIRLRGPMKFLRRGAIPVPDEHRNAFDMALRSHGVAAEEVIRRGMG